MIIGGKNFDTANHTYIMGILNVTPDSFPMEESLTEWMRQLHMHTRWLKKV